MTIEPGRAAEVLTRGGGVWSSSERSGTAPAWKAGYRRVLVASDAVVAALAAATAYFVRFGREATPAEELVYSLAILVLPLVWLVALLFCRAYEYRFLDVGSEEFRRVIGAGLIVSAIVSTMSYSFRLELARGFVLLALPLVTALTLLGRYGARKWLHRRRHHGQCLQKVIVVGHSAGVEALVRQIRSARYHGLEIAGACVPGGLDEDGFLADQEVPVLGGFEDVLAAVEEVGADVVAVMPSPEMDGPALRRLGWQLEVTNAELLVAPAVVEVVGPRIHIRPVCGLPLLHVERPEFEGARRFAKAAFDRCLALGTLALLAPVLVTIAVAIKTTSPGPVFFRQQRVGRAGTTFTMFKFRTMVRGAHLMVPQLQEVDEGNGVLFKIRNDPRVTRVGRLLRRFSVDELPQLINVALGHMSLVGPRPPLPAEVELYGDDMRRRLLVKPGLTGLWQISGRSDLSWDESVRIDLRYVENWSFAFDFMIIWKTFGAVIRSRGAY